MERTISSVIRSYFPALALHHKLPLYQHKAASLIARCGRSEMGGHLERCPCALTEHIVWHSCKHCLCPRCANKARVNWLEHESARLLPCAHHHIIFTFPHDLLGIWRYNRALVTDALFHSAADTLTGLLADPRYLGAVPGIHLALHTWSRAMALHPHIHALTTDGGLHDGQWITPRRSHFLPARVVKALFWGKLLALLSELFAEGKLKLPPDRSPERFRSLLNRLGRIKWHLWLCGRYAHGQGVLAYLARYLRGGPLRDSQLVRADDKQIVLRYLEHAPITGQHQLRRYGLYATAARAKRELARARVPPAAQRAPRREAPYPLLVPCCPYCGQPLRFVCRISPLRVPP